VVGFFARSHRRSSCYSPDFLAELGSHFLAKRGTEDKERRGGKENGGEGN